MKQCTKPVIKWKDLPLETKDRITKELKRPLPSSLKKEPTLRISRSEKNKYKTKLCREIVIGFVISVIITGILAYLAN
jgi:hypothetical protein